MEVTLHGSIFIPSFDIICPNNFPAVKEKKYIIRIERNRKEIQSFLGKVNFVRRFIPNFAEIFKHITKMLRKDYDIKWMA